MPDDLDDLDAVLRRTMASLDRQTPAGYFDELPARTLARLDDAATREPGEDPGLDDVRDLASETRARLSAQRAAPARDDEAVAASSVWKAVALPATTGPQPAGSPGMASPPAQSAGATDPLPAQRPVARGRRAAWVAIAGGLAAAGVVGYLAVGNRAPGGAELTAMTEDRAATGGKPAPPTTAVALDAGVPAVAVAPTVDERRAAIVVPRPADTGASLGAPPRAHESAGKATNRPTTAKKATAKRADLKAPAKTDGLGSPIDNLKPGDPIASSGSAKPSDSGKPTGEAGGAVGSGSAQVPLDQLLGESGATKPAPAKAKLERTSLSSDDIKRGMNSVARKAQACYAGTQGLASLRLTVAPTGRVVKVAVTGMFADSPTGTCVERAVKAARFPPWDGGPQSFNYNYLLSD